MITIQAMIRTIKDLQSRVEKLETRIKALEDIDEVYGVKAPEPIKESVENEVVIIESSPEDDIMNTVEKKKRGRPAKIKE